MEKQGWGWGEETRQGSEFLGATAPSRLLLTLPRPGQRVTTAATSASEGFLSAWSCVKRFNLFSPGK